MISIIIPVYNQAKKLAKCLESILNQTYQNFEIIIVNDGSSDNPGEIVEKYKRKFPNLKYFDHGQNRGAPAARNTGFKNSQGEYLFFCDADTVLIPEALNIFFNTLAKNSSVNYVYSNFYWGRKLFRQGKFDAQKLKKQPYIHTMSLIRREDFPINGWDESLKKFQDWDLWLTMLENGKTGIWIDQILFKVIPGGTISSWLPSFAYKLFPFLPEVKKYKKALAIIKAKHNLK